MTSRTRREFLGQVGRGMIASSVGLGLAAELGLAAPIDGGEGRSTELDFGPLEPLVRLMQETPIERLLPVLVKQLESGTDLTRLAAAAPLANARSFRAEEYVGFPTIMA